MKTISISYKRTPFMSFKCRSKYITEVRASFLPHFPQATPTGNSTVHNTKSTLKSYTYLFIANINNSFFILLLVFTLLQNFTLTEKGYQCPNNLKDSSYPHRWFGNFNYCDYCFLQRDHFREDHEMQMSLKWFCAFLYCLGWRGALKWGRQRCFVVLFQLPEWFTASGGILS